MSERLKWQDELELFGRIKNTLVLTDNIYDCYPVAGDDASDVCWAAVKMTEGQVEVALDGKSVIRELAFDHYEIISDAYEVTI